MFGKLWRRVPGVTLALAAAALPSWGSTVAASTLATASLAAAARAAIAAAATVSAALATATAIAAALAAAALAAAALALAAALAPPAALAIRLHINRRHVGGWASSVPVSRRRSRKHPQRRGERRCTGHHH